LKQPFKTTPLLVQLSLQGKLHSLDKQTVYIKDLGNIVYADAWTMQEEILQKNVAIKSAARISGNDSNPLLLKTINHLLLCEHPHVYTLGKSGSESNIIFTESQRIEKGIEFFKINRGGDITYHGPGQIVGYPILDLEKFKTDIGWYLRNMEETVILFLKNYGVEAGRSAGETGVWIDADNPKLARKICAIGVRCSRWITMHGFALNINTELDYFNGIIPCGIQDKDVTSLKKELGKEVDMQEAKKMLMESFEQVFNVKFIA
jgi:lipoyl(octanoyl) transferase